MTTATIEVAGANEVAAPQAAPPPTDSFKVGELKAGAFATIKNDFKNPSDAIELLNYIDFLAQNNATSADDLQLPFKKGEKHEWKLTRAEVTQLFFGYIEKREADGKKDVVLPNEAAKQAINKAMNDRKANSLASVRRTADQHRANASANAQAWMSNLKAARKIEEDLEAAMNVDPTARIQAVMDGLASTNWNFHSFASNMLMFVSRSDIIMRHIEPKAGLRYELNCGKFMLKIHLDYMTPTIHRFERNALPVGGNFHPHIEANGHVCWGNGADAMGVAVSTGNILGIISIVDRMIPHYNAESPYITIESLKQRLDARDQKEREDHVKKEQAAKAGPAPAAAAASGAGLEDQDILDDEPEFTDDIEWSEGGDNE